MRRSSQNVRDANQKEFIKTFDRISDRHSRWKVWHDFICISAIAISNCVDSRNAASREKTYKTIESSYTKEEMDLFPKMLDSIVDGIENNPDQDFLGELYMALQLGNDRAGQFFTPYSVCRAMAMMNSGIGVKVQERGWISVIDPACGAGALLVAFANECARQGVNFQTSVLFVAQDIDPTVGMMCYLQLSLIGCPGYVCIGDSISNPSTSIDEKGLIPHDNGNIWYTPMYFRDMWHFRRKAALMDMYLKSIDTTGLKEESIEVPKVETKKLSETQTGQLSFF